MKRISVFCSLSILLLSCTCAQWPATQNVDFTVCDANANQQFPLICSDGDGGSIITWMDYRGNFDLYCQRIDKFGNKRFFPSPGDLNGIWIGSSSNGAIESRIVEDGRGGAYIFWRHGTSMRVQLIDSCGIPQYTAGGEIIVIQSGSQQEAYSKVVSDGHGNAIMSFFDTSPNIRLYFARFTHHDTISWITNQALFSLSPNIDNHWLAADSIGGIYEIYRNGVGYGFIRVDSLGDTAHAKAISPGLLLSYGDDDFSVVNPTLGGTGFEESNYDSIATLKWQKTYANPSGFRYSGDYCAVPTAGDGAIYCWTRYSGISEREIRIQKNDSIQANSAGIWNNGNPVELTNLPGTKQECPVAVSDGKGGVKVVWIDQNVGNTSFMYQHVDSLGNILCQQNGMQVESQTASGIAFGGLIQAGDDCVVIVWSDNRGLNRDIYAKKICGCSYGCGAQILSNGQSGSSDSICPGDTILLSVTAQAGVSYQWYQNGAVVGSDTNIHHASSQGAYTLALIAGTDTTFSGDTIDVFVFPGNAASIGNLDPVYCDNDEPDTLSGNPSGGTWTGQGVSTGIFFPAFAPLGQNVISYSVLDSNQCPSIISDTTTVVAAPNPSFSVPGSLCKNDSPISLIGSSSGGIFSGQGVSGNVFSPDSVTAGTYNIYYEYLDQQSGCMGRDTQTVLVEPLVDAQFIYTGSGIQYAFMESSTGASEWLWDFGDGTTDTLQHPWHTYLTAGSYTVCLFASNSACSDSTCRTITIVGIAENLAKNLVVYPNPSISRFRVSGIPELDLGTASVRVLNVEGRRINPKISVTPGGLLVDLSEYPNGRYYFEIRIGLMRRIVLVTKL